MNITKWTRKCCILPIKECKALHGAPRTVHEIRTKQSSVQFTCLMRYSLSGYMLHYTSPIVLLSKMNKVIIVSSMPSVENTDWSTYSIVSMLARLLS